MKYSFSTWRKCLCSLLFFWLLNNAFAEVSDARKKQLMQLVDEPRYDCKYLSAEEKEFLKGYFYEVKKRTNPEAHDNQLLQVGDESTIERFVKRYQSGEYVTDEMIHSGQAIFIEVCAPNMFRDEPLVFSEGDTPGLAPLSYGTAHILVLLLRASPQLSPEVRHWALSLNEKELEKNRTLLQKWWRANERHFHERNYAAVQPPPDASASPSPADTFPPSPNTERSETPPPAAPAAAGPPMENSSLLAGLITALCATLLALAYWLCTRRGKPHS